MYVDTNQAPTHNCQCYLYTGGVSVYSEVYRGFILHCWGEHLTDWCALPVEVAIEEVAPIIQRVPYSIHFLGGGEQTQCFTGLSHPYALVDGFWQVIHDRMGMPA